MVCIDIQNKTQLKQLCRNKRLFARVKQHEFDIIRVTLVDVMIWYSRCQEFKYNPTIMYDDRFVWI